MSNLIIELMIKSKSLLPSVFSGEDNIIKTKAVTLNLLEYLLAHNIGGLIIGLDTIEAPLKENFKKNKNIIFADKDFKKAYKELRNPTSKKVIITNEFPRKTVMANITKILQNYAGEKKTCVIDNMISPEILGLRNPDINICIGTKRLHSLGKDDLSMETARIIILKSKENMQKAFPKIDTQPLEPKRLKSNAKTVT